MKWLNVIVFLFILLPSHPINTPVMDRNIADTINPSLEYLSRCSPDGYHYLLLSVAAIRADPEYQLLAYANRDNSTVYIGRMFRELPPASYESLVILLHESAHIANPLWSEENATAIAETFVWSTCLR